MADEIKKVVTIDAGNSITTLKEYKQHIDDLRGALLALDQTSEEYKDISQEITEEQARLNEVMKVGKNNADAAEGSYNQLVQTMAELKKQWRATADEAERADLGQQILDINNQLKDLDASTGNFQRNVGDYANAFEEAFKQLAGSINGINGNIGTIMNDVTRMIPLIKKVTTTATAGINGVKKALLSTGIGALVVALGLILSHWQEISEWVRKTTGFVDQHAAAIANLQKQMEDFKKDYAETLDLLSYQYDMMKAQGKSTEEVLAKQLEDEKKLAEQAFNEEMRLYSIWANNKDNIDKELVAERKKNADEAEEHRKETERNVELTSRKLNEERQRLITEQLETVKTLDESVQAQADILTQHFNEAMAAAGDTARWQMAAIKEYLDGLRDLTAANTDTTTEEDKRAAEEAKRRAEAARQQREAERKAAEEIINRIKESNMTELELLENKYNEEKAIVEKGHGDLKILEEQYQKDRLAIIQKNTEAEEKALRDTMEARTAANMEWLEQQASQQEFEVDNSLEIQTEQAIAEQKYQIEKDLIERKIGLQEELIAAMNENYMDTTEQEMALSQMRQELANLDMARAKEVVEFKREAEKEAAQNTKMVWESASKSVASIFGSLSDMMEEGSAEQKAFAVMETTINTISGAIAAYKSMASIPYVGPALGAAAAAAVGVAGAASIKKIMETKKGSGGSGTVDVPTPEAPNMSAVVSPLLNEEQDIQGMTSLNEQGDSQGKGSQRVYVVESDIQEVGNRVKVRENESTF